jgi:hypothetical protein
MREQEARLMRKTRKNEHALAAQQTPLSDATEQFLTAVAQIDAVAGLLLAHAEANAAHGRGQTCGSPLDTGSALDAAFRLLLDASETLTDRLNIEVLLGRELTEQRASTGRQGR